jgi:hypothetical protein
MSKIQTNVARSFREAEEFDRRFWRRAGTAARWAASWSMVLDFIKMRGGDESELRLRRSVQNVKRA